MSKKNFKTSLKPQPTIEAIEQYVNEGYERDVQSVNTETQKNGNAGNKPITISRLTIDLPINLHRRFKSLTGLVGSTMVDEIRQFIEKRVTELEDSK